MTVIADSRGREAIGGIMGGEESGCSLETTDVFLEVALFDPIQVARTGRKLGILSDARYRFERGVDPESAGWGVEYRDPADPRALRRRGQRRPCRAASCRPGSGVLPCAPIA